MAFQKFAALCIALSGSVTLADAAQVQMAGLALPASAVSYRQEVVNLFNDTYSAYTLYAYGHDDLAPLSKGFIDARNGWGATIVDSLGTMYLMGLDSLFLDGVNFVSHVDFSKGNTSDTVSVFETTIRYLGGLLSAYELSGQSYPVLLQKAQQVADKLAYAWTNNHVVPYGFLQPTSNNVVVATSNIAEAGTLTMEWYTLSHYTGNDTYRALAEGSARHIAASGSPLPGMAAQGIDPSTGLPVGSYVTWGGGSDSYFEYLIKYARLTNTADPLWADTWATAVDSSMKTLARRTTVGNWLYLADWSNGTIRHIGSHLGCFSAGNWILGGKLLNNDTIVQTGLTLNDACWNTYASSSTGIGPEVFAYISSDGNYTGAPLTQANIDYYNLHGNYPYETFTYYYLRPEVLESNFYAWRVTGDTKYLDRAASAIKSFQTYLKAPVGYAGILDVNNPSAGQINDTESFWYAEVLKYLYLTFDDPTKISLDDWVFNTEAHPLRAPPSKPFYGGTTIPTPTSSFNPLVNNPVVPAISPAPALQVPLVDAILNFFF